MATADFVHLRSGHAYYPRPGLLVIGFAGNGDAGYSKNAWQLRQAADWTCFVNNRRDEQAKYLPASWAEVIHFLDDSC
jgi:hypothetical protein